jgi:hypothetical protein
MWAQVSTSPGVIRKPVPRRLSGWRINEQRSTSWRLLLDVTKWTQEAVVRGLSSLAQLPPEDDVIGAIASLGISHTELGTPSGHP